MNPKNYSILFCILLASNFIHDIRVKASANPSFTSRIVKRQIVGPFCRWVCFPPLPNFNENRVTIFANVDAQLFSATNRSANASFVVDIKANLIAALNGTTGEAVVINITSNTGVSVSKGAWVAKTTSIDAYLASLKNGLAPLFKSGSSNGFKVENASKATIQAVNQVLVKLIIDLSVQVQSSPKVGLQLFVALGSGIVGLFRGSLNGYLSLFESYGFSVTRDLSSSLNVLQALGLIFSKIPGGLKAVIKSDANFSNEEFAQAGNGVDRLVYIINTLGADFDLGAALKSILNDVKSFFKLVADLGGNGNIGADGLFRTLSVIVGYIKGDGTSLEIVINVIIRFLAANQKNQADNKDLSASLDTSISTLLEAVGRIAAVVSLAGLIETGEAWLEGTLVIKGVSISAIKALLISGITGENQLQILVAVLLQLKPVVDPAISIPSAILVLIINLHSPLGILLLQGIGIVIDIGIGIGILGSILINILKSVLNLIGLLFGGIFNALIRLPVISDILKGLAKALTDVSNNGLDLKGLITSNKATTDLIIGVFQVISGINLGASKNVTTQAEQLLKNCSNVNFYLTLDLDVTIVA